MSSFRVPAFLRPRRSFHRLKSFHLSPAEETATAISQARRGGTKSPSLNQPDASNAMQIGPRLTPSNLVIPLRGGTIVTLAIISSLFFIMSLSFAFIGADAGEPYFMHMLDTVAETSPGVVLIGESVDVDIDEPSITIRWSIVACGDDFILSGSAGMHGSKKCGLPTSPIQFYVDNDNNPAATYDPSEIPFDKDTGHRRSIQNLVQFDSDHVLDVHEARLYPFDTYTLSSTIRAISFDNQTIPIRKIATIDMTSSFNIETVDLESFSTNANGVEDVSRDIDMHVTRPNQARFFALLLFTVGWILAHLTIGHVLIARRLHGLKALFPHIVSSGAVLMAVPQLRNTMPDAPGLDGVLIDCIGFFPQMLIISLSTITLLLILIVREFENTRNNPLAAAVPPMHHQRPALISQFPSPPRGPSTSMEIAQWEMRRLIKHLKGEYVFPPVKSSHRLQPSDPVKPSHRRVKTMSKIMEAGEVSHWSDEER